MQKTNIHRKSPPALCFPPFSLNTQSGAALYCKPHCLSHTHTHTHTETETVRVERTLSLMTHISEITAADDQTDADTVARNFVFLST